MTEISEWIKNLESDIQRVITDFERITELQVSSISQDFNRNIMVTVIAPREKVIPKVVQQPIGDDSEPPFK